MKKWLSIRHLLPDLVKITPVLGVLAAVCLPITLFWSLYGAPSDYQQQDAYRILFIHVPAAFLSLAIYTVMAIASVLYCIFRIRVMDKILWAAAPVGAVFTAIALLTGAIWGKPMWGTFWVWDARLTSELLLLFIYSGVILLHQALQTEGHSLLPAHVLTVVGWVNIPIVHFSVLWWHTLHQGPTLSKLARPEMPASMLMPLIFALITFTLCALYSGCLRLQRACLEEK